MSPAPTSLDDARRLHLAGRLGHARPIYDAIIDTEPGNDGALHLRGMLALQEGDGALAEQLVRQALALVPASAAYLSGLGQILYFKGDPDGAAEAWTACLDLNPGDGGAAYNYGTLCLQRRQNNLAEKWLRAAIDHGEQDNWEAHSNLANALARLRRYGDAEASYRAAQELSPDNVSLLTSYADVAIRIGGLEKAAALLDCALRLAPDFAPAYLNLANLRMAEADVPGALQALEKALEQDPGLADAHHKRLFFSHYIKDLSAEELYHLHRDWGAGFAAEIDAIPPAAPLLAAGEVLRIGYVSADLGGHSVGLFMASIIAAHDREQFHITCYSGLESEDSLTKSIKADADGWRETAALSDASLAETIRRDGIHILVDLSGHTGGHRLGVFALRPAPVQISYLGYPGTVGLAAIDYRISDEWCEPAGAADDCSVEKILRIDGGFHCFAGAGEDVEPGPAPVAENGFITFASFNNIAKLNADVIRLWAGVLDAVPDARLCLKDQRLKYDSNRRHIEAAFARHGIEPARLSLLGAQAERRDHLAQYGKVDIALDPFPYNGTTTTAEALWMGVPVITMTGQRADARVGLSLLSQMQLDELIAGSPDAYIAIAAGLAADREKLRALRPELRGRLRGASLGRVAEFTEKLEAAYRLAWNEATGGT
ncbi:MAG: tetratricopeptide repeat protein [Rhodospirillaceae bacterium]|nr:tetratricopeptide repeat protein [Rhodospirillaceae bacterium]